MATWRQCASLPLAALLLAANACSHKSSPVAPDTIPDLVSNGTFSAAIAGTTWTAIDSVTVAKPTTTNLDVTASSTTYTVTLRLAGFTGPGVYPLTGPSIFGSSANVTLPNGMRWASGGLNTVGSITITTITESRVVGSFAFDAIPITGGATTLIHVTKGSFDVAY